MSLYCGKCGTYYDETGHVCSAVYPPLQCVEMHFITKYGEKAIVTIAASAERLAGRQGTLAQWAIEAIIEDSLDKPEFALVHTRRYEMGKP